MSNILSFMITEKNLFLAESNDFFNLYSNTNLPHYNEENYLRLKYSPTLKEYLIIESIALEFQQSIKENYLHIKWPENIGIQLEVLDYLNKKAYKLGKKELMKLAPKNWKKKNRQNNWKILIVDDSNLEVFLQLNYQEDFLHGEDFAKLKQEVYHYLYRKEHTEFLMITLDNMAIGSTIINKYDHFIELDHVLTALKFRQKGVATYLINHLVKEALVSNSELILFADSEDKPLELYEKMGFTTVSSQISALFHF